LLPTGKRWTSAAITNEEVALPQDPSTVPYELHVVHQAGACIVRVIREFDLAAADELRDRAPELQLDQVSELVVDLREVTFIDSSGINAILELWNTARADGIEVSLLAGDKVQALLRMVGLEEALPILDAPNPDGASTGL
jgi:anti-sigma B factor antagonist